METIEVFYAPTALWGAWHKYILYTDKDGNQRYGRGGPENAFPKDFGNIDTEWGEYNPRTPDWAEPGVHDGELIIQGDDLSSYWESIEQTLSTMDLKHEYRLWESNSNSTVDYALSQAGLPSAQMDGPGGKWSPATDQPLWPSNPIPPLEPGEPSQYPLWPLSPPSFFDPQGPFFNPPISPLVLDFDGDGLDLVPLSLSAAYFDLNENGFAEHTAWIGPDDGFLALDRNGDGIINDLSELFGGADIDGFTVLAALDSNNDGKITQTDARYGDLLIWRDLNGDGLTNDGELADLVSMSVAEISLTADFVDYWIGENWVSHESGYQGPGGEGRIYDVWFENNQTNTIYAYGQSFSYSEEILKLPELRGWGSLPNLRVSMSQSVELRASVESLIAASNTASSAVLREMIEDVLFIWSGADEVVAGSRGASVDAKHLAFLEAIHGTAFEAVGGGANPGNQAGIALEGLYENVLNSLTAKLLVQLPAAYAAQENDADLFWTHPLVALLAYEYDPAIDELVGSTTSLAELLALKLDGTEAGRASFLDLALALGFVLSEVQSTPGSDPASEIVDRLPSLGVPADLIRTAELAMSDTLLLGTAGNDTITLHGDHAVMALQGDDVITGSARADQYIYFAGDGADRIIENYAPAASDRLILGAGLTSTNVQVGRASNSNDVVLTFAGQSGSIRLDDTFLHTSSGYGYGVELVEFADGVTWTQADLGAAYLEAVQTSGDDLIYGFDGADSYSYNIGDGADRIVEGYAPGASDRLVLGAGLTSANVRVGRVSNSDDVVLTFAGQAGSIRLDDSFLNTSSGYGYGVELIEFADGVTWTKADLGAAYLASIHDAGDNLIYGFDGADRYSYNIGDGADRIVEGYASGVSDRLVLGTGLTSTNVVVGRVSNSNDVVLKFVGQSGSIQLDDTFLHTSSGYGYGVEFVEFADGVTWTRDDLGIAYLAAAQTTGDDVIYGFDGADTYSYNIGDGSDRIVEGYAPGGVDRLVLGAGLTSTNVQVGRVSNSDDVVLTFAGQTGSIRLDDSFLSSSSGYGYGVELIEFADGVTWTKADLGAAYLATIHNSSDDLIYGFDGADTYSYNMGDGADRIIEGYAPGASDRLVLGAGLTSTNVQVGRFSNSDDVVLTFAGQTGSIRLDDTFLHSSSGSGYGVEFIDFADGVSWNRADLGTAYLAAMQTSGNDVIYGFDGADIYSYNIGDGADRIVEGYAPGAADRLVLGAGLNSSDLFIQRIGSSNDLILSFAGISGSIEIDDALNGKSGYGLEQIVFGDGTIWSQADLEAAALSQTAITGTAGANTLLGSATGDYIQGLGGTDSLWGLAGRDMLFGGAGDDQLSGGEGEDRIDGGEGYDTAVFAGASDQYVFTRSGNGEVVVTDKEGLAESDILVAVEAVYFEADQAWRSIEQLVGAYGTVASDSWIGGTDGDDKLFGLSGDDNLSPGAGHDIVDGGNGIDQITLVGSIEDYVFSRSESGDVEIASLITGDGDKRLISVEGVYFGGDENWRSINELVSDFGTEQSDSWISGRSGSDNLFGFAGDDTIKGLSGDDFIYGGEGVDTAVFNGSLSDFRFTRNADGSVLFEDLGGNDGADILIDIEQVYFEGDQTFAYMNSLIGGYGTVGDDAWIDGTMLDDELYGLDGDDTFKGREGDDLINGGLGFDQVVYDAAIADLKISRQQDGSYLIKDLSYAEGVDHLIGVESLYSEADQRWYLLSSLV